MTSLASRLTKAERKAWAREAFLGAECSLLPSFKPGSLELDEAGVRHDVRQGIRQGFYAMFCAGVGLTPEERDRFVAIAADEAGDQILISTGGGGRGSVEAAIESLRKAEALGCSHVMFGLPSGPGLRDAEDVYTYSRQVIESTDLGIVLYATRRAGGAPPARVAPGGAGLGWRPPVDILERLAALPNVVGMKVTQVMDGVSTYELCHRLGDKILIGPVNLEHLPLTARICPIQCTMMWQVDACQSPEKPYVVDYLNLLADNRIDEAVAVYRQMEPLVQLFWEEQAAVLREGGHPWEHLKYHSWCVGANGGPLRPADEGHAIPPLTPAGRKLIRETYARSGIEPREPDAEFDAGRVNFG